MYLLKGYWDGVPGSPGDPHPEDGELPFWEFYRLATDFGWDWQHYLTTPPLVASYLLLYHSIEAPLRAQAQQGG